ncbi:MAG: O-antigen ligase family protein [Elusimicrobiota bacterium]
MPRERYGLWLLAAALLCGGLRDPRLAALGEAGIFALVWLERPALGPAAVWLPWLVWAYLASMLSLQPLAAVSSLARWSAVLAFGSLAAMWGEREAWLKTLVVLAVILAAAALWTGAAGGFHAAMTGLIPPYYNYTSFALAAGSAAAAAWALHPRAGRPSIRIAGLAAAAVGVGCLALAHSRGAVLGLAVAAAVWSLRRWGAKAGWVMLVGAGLAAGASRANLVPDSWRAALAKRGVYQEARPQIWSRAAAIADEQPWFGAGPGGFGAAFRRRPVEVLGGRARWGMGTEYAHSEIFQAAAETGWAGLALWLTGLGASFSVLFRRARAEPAREAAAIAVAAMAIPLAVDNMLQIPGLALLFFSAVAVAGENPSGGRRWPRAAALAGGLLALTAWIPRALAEGNPSRAAALFPAESEPREDLGSQALIAGRNAEADAFFAEAERLSPFNAVYPWRRAQIAAAQGHWADAERFSGRAAALEPGFLNDRVLRAQALDRLGRTRDARDELAAVLLLSRQRGHRPGSSGYDDTVWNFDEKEYDRADASIGGPKR